MSIEAPATFQVRDNVWKSLTQAGIARERVDECHRVSGCTFEVKAAIIELAPAQSDRSDS